MIIVDCPEYTANGSRATLATAMGLGVNSRIRWFHIGGISVGASPARIGGSGVTIGRGIAVYNNGSYTSPVAGGSAAGDMYDPNQIYIIALAGNELSLAYAQ